jgi:hypothetical protein
MLAALLPTANAPMLRRLEFERLSMKTPNFAGE